MKLRGGNKNKITKYKNSENVSNLQITELVLVHCNIVNNDYQQDSRVMYTLIPVKLFGQLQDISPKNYIFLKTFIQSFHILKHGLLITIEVLEMEDKINLTLVIN